MVCVTRSRSHIFEASAHIPPYIYDVLGVFVAALTTQKALYGLRLVAEVWLTLLVTRSRKRPHGNQ